MDIRDTYQFIVLAVLLALSAFFSSIETALMSVNRIRLRTLSDDGNKRAALALDILENKTPKMLSAILIGNNIVNVYASSLATTLAYHLGGYMVSIATLALTVAILVFGEITPKNYATLNSEKLTLRYITVIHFLMTLMTPVIFVINLISRFFLYILHVDPDAVNKAMTEEELRTIVDVSHEDGVIESDEKKNDLQRFRSRRCRCQGHHGSPCQCNFCQRKQYLRRTDRYFPYRQIYPSSSL